jgi:phytoene synthase
MMAMIMGITNPHALARACELGNAMQLTNIARDVGEDARNGRLYLPRSWMRQAGIDPYTWLANPQFTPALGDVVGRLLLEADRLYQRGSSGIAALPRDCRSAILAASTIYSEIGRVIAERQMNSIDGRAVVGSTRKLTLLCLAKARAQLPTRCEPEAPLPAIQFLVDACALAGERKINGITPKSFDERCEWVIDLFERLSTPGRQV